MSGRIYRTLDVAFNEIQRDLKEMGVSVATKTYQDKNIEGKEEFETLEIQNYLYTVLWPRLQDLEPIHPWCEAEWAERKAGIEGNPVNPGQAYKLRPEVWDQFLQSDKRFSYSYSERFSTSNYEYVAFTDLKSQVQAVIERLKEDPHSRQAYVAMWDPNSDPFHLGKLRVPCTLGYHFMYREGKLDVTYSMRSCDFATHFKNDIYMALMLRDYVAYHAGLAPGKFTHFINSFHVYKKDVKDVF